MKPDLIIFTDGSAQLDKPQYGGYSCVFLDPVNFKFSILYDNIQSSKSPFLELYAIYMAVLYADKIRISRKMDHIRVVILSDHKNHVNALNKWIWNVWNISDPAHWIKAKNTEEVKNQTYYRKILDILDKGNITIKIIHMKSHIKKDMNNIDIMRSNLADQGLYVNLESTLAFMKFNSIADAYAKYAGGYYQKRFNKQPKRLR